MSIRHPDRPYRVVFDDGSIGDDRFVKVAQARAAIRSSGQGGRVERMVAGHWHVVGKPVAARTTNPAEARLVARLLRT